MSLAQHHEAFTAFQGNDSLLTGLQSKITSYRKKQEDDQKTKDCYDWITVQRSVREKETAVTKQMCRACSRVLELLQEEDGHEELCIDPRNRADAINLLKGVIATIMMPDQNKQLSQLLRGIMRLKDKPEIENELAAASLKDLRATLATSISDMDKNFAVQSDETAHLRREVMSTTSIGEYDTKQLPASISRALCSLRTLLKEHHADDNGEIDIQEQGLREQFERAHAEQKRILDEETVPPCWDEKSQITAKKTLNFSTGLNSTAFLVDRLKMVLPGKTETEIIAYIEYRNAQKASKQKLEAAAEDYKRKCHLLESDGLRVIDHLLKKYRDKARTSTIKGENELKSKELSLRLKSIRVEREEIRRTKVTNADKELKALSQKNGDEFRNNLHRAQMMLKNKQAIIQHRARKFVEVRKENCANEFINNVAVEIETLKRQETNRERSVFREVQIHKKLIQQRKVEEELCIAEKARLERLNNLVSNVPYFNSIMEKTSDIHKTTQARKNDVYKGRSNLADFQCGKMKGFTNERCFSDAKFRLGNALHEAGVARSTHARDVVREVIPRSEERTTGIKPY